MKKYLFLIIGIIFLIASVSANQTTVFALSTNADGRIGVTANVSTTTFEILRSSPGNSGSFTANNLSAMAVTHINSVDWGSGTIFGFGWSGNANASGMPTNAVIDSAYFQVSSDVVKQDDFTSMNVTIVALSPLDSANLAVGDWQRRNTALKYSAPTPYSLWNTSSNMSFTITNLSAISASGITSLLITSGWDAYNQAPSNSPNYASKLGIYDTSNTGTNKDPNLVITWHYPSSANPPTASFTSNVTSGYSPLAVQFNDTSIDSPTNWNWSFQDIIGNNTQIWFSQIQNPVLTFGTSGNFLIKLNASNLNGYNISTANYFVNTTNAPVTAYYYAYGDSITSNYGTSNYIQVMNRTYDPSHTAFNNIDGAGWTSQSGYNGMTTHKNATIEYVLFGTNDRWYAQSGLQTASYLKQIYNYFTGLGITTHIMIPPLMQNGSGSSGTFADQANNISIVQTNLTEQGIPYIKLYDSIDSNPCNGQPDPANLTLLNGDGVHPTGAAHAIFAQYMWNSTSYCNTNFPVTPTPTTPPPTTTTIPPTTTVPTTTIPPTTTSPTPIPTPSNSTCASIICSQVTDHTIQWTWWANITNITGLTADGYKVNNFDPMINTFILSDLQSNTSHELIIYYNNTSASNIATTDISIIDILTKLVYDWFPVFIILGLFICGFAIHWLIFFIGSGVSLYFLYDWIQRYPTQTVGITNLHFLIYAALFILGLILWLFRRKGR